jgi:transcriptional regulator with PAS, ATPase and Fis domain
MQQLYFDYSDICDSMKQNPNAFFMAVDNNRNIKSISQTLLDLLGLQKEEAVGKYFMDIVPDGKLLEVLKTGHIDEADTLSINGHDTVVTRIPIKKNQQVAGAFIYSLFFDISRAESLIKEYQKNKPKFNRILDQVIGSPNMGYIVIDKEMRVTHVNQTYLDILGKGLEEAIGKPIREVSPYSKLPRVIETGLPDKVDVWSVNGNNMIVNRLPIMQNDEVIGAIGHTLVLDISVPKFLVNKLQETNLEFNVIFQGLIESPYAAYTIVDKEGYITVMNNTYLDIIKKRRSEVIGKHILEIMPHSKLLETLSSGRMETADVWPIVEGRDIIVNRLPIKEDGDIIGAIEHSLVLDISGAKILLKKLQETERELNLYKDEVRAMYNAKWTFDNLKGNSHEFVTVKAMAKQFSQTSSTLLITGESGTGKELFAQAIHNASSRKLGPFIRINCAALPENLLESELFGYEEGAFTGAKKGGKPGKFELAKGGTIFLDEIGDMPLTMQTKLLSVLQERVVERVGGTTPLPINVRVIAATNRKLEEMVASHEFREDLYYRLNVVQLRIPPLRRRMEDLPALVEVLIVRISEKLEINIEKISDQAMELLKKYHWPGNVRELENLVERAINLAHMRDTNCIDWADFPSLMDNNTSYMPGDDDFAPLNLTETVEDLEKHMIVQALEKAGQNKTKAAQYLGIHSSALYRKLNKYGLG